MKKTLILSALITIALDQLTKYWVVVGLGMADRPPLFIHDFFSLVMVWNHGISFGMFSAPDSRLNAYILAGLALVISTLLARVALKSAYRLEITAYGMIIGGALGNALDRIRLGAVADFLYFHYQQYGWPAFNIADSAICIGVGFLLLHLFKNSRVPA